MKLVNSDDLYFMPQPRGRKICPAAFSTQHNGFLDHFFAENLKPYFIIMDAETIQRGFHRCVLAMEQFIYVKIIRFVIHGAF
jgi:hypothetical protein